MAAHASGRDGDRSNRQRGGSRSVGPSTIRRGRTLDSQAAPRVTSRADPVTPIRPRRGRSMWRVAALALPLLGAAPAAADGPRRARVLFVPPPADAPADLRELAGAIAGRLRRSPSLALIHEDRLRGALALAPARPAAGELRQTVDAALGRVEDAYRRLAVDEAVQALQELENARLNALACPESIGLAAQISFWLGIVLAASAETDRASERFRVALFVDPHRPIDAAYFPPQTVALFERVRARLAAAPTGSLSIATDPDAAEVYLDGRRAGVAPLTATASEGDHFVCVRRVGSRDWAARLRVFAGRVETQRIFLPRAAPGEIAAQLAGLLASPGSLDLGSAAHVEAMAAAVGADVVARAVLPAAIEYRAVGPRAAVDRVVARAPAAVVEQEKGRVQEFEAALAKLGAQRASVAALPD